MVNPAELDRRSGTAYSGTQQTASRRTQGNPRQNAGLAPASYNNIPWDPTAPFTPPNPSAAFQGFMGDRYNPATTFRPPMEFANQGAIDYYSSLGANQYGTSGGGYPQGGGGGGYPQPPWGQAPPPDPRIANFSGYANAYQNALNSYQPSAPGPQLQAPTAVNAPQQQQWTDRTYTPYTVNDLQVTDLAAPTMFDLPDAPKDRLTPMIDPAIKKDMRFAQDSMGAVADRSADPYANLNFQAGNFDPGISGVVAAQGGDMAGATQAQMEGQSDQDYTASLFNNLAGSMSANQQASNMAWNSDKAQNTAAILQYISGQGTGLKAGAIARHDRRLDEHGREVRGINQQNILRTDDWRNTNTMRRDDIGNQNIMRRDDADWRNADRRDQVDWMNADGRDDTWRYNTGRQEDYDWRNADRQDAYQRALYEYNRDDRMMSDAERARRQELMLQLLSQGYDAGADVSGISY